MRVTRSRELVAAGYKPRVAARVAQISRQAIYRVVRDGSLQAITSTPAAAGLTGAAAS